VMIHNDSQIHQAVTILEAHHPIGIEENTDEEAAGTTAGSAAQLMATSPAPTMGGDPPAGAAGHSMPASASAASASEEVIPIAEENIEVGKRTVDRGTARVRRYVVETPIEREVTLHGERVTVERRRPVELTVCGRGQPTLSPAAEASAGGNGSVPVSPTMDCRLGATSGNGSVPTAVRRTKRPPSSPWKTAHDP
jgi:hypothetical protein